MVKFTMEELRKCAEREFKKRDSVYPRWVAAGKLTQGQADRELAMMKAIASDYEERAKGERLL